MVSPFYFILGALSIPPFRLLYRLRASGQENLPESGGYVLSANHLSNVDPWPLGLPLWPKRQIRFMAKSELFRPPLRPILELAGAFRLGGDPSTAYQFGISKLIAALSLDTD